MDEEAAAAAKVRELKAQGLGVSAIADEMGISRASVYRVLPDDLEADGPDVLSGDGGGGTIRAASSGE